MNIQHFISELRRRNVFRVATAYAIVGWLIIQVVVAISGPLNLPEWVPAFFIILVAVGFPIALVIAWAFELTPDGLRKTNEVTKTESIAPKTGKRINRIIIASLSALVVFLLAERIFFATSVGIAEVPAPVLTAALTDKSIAVLPFDDFNAGGEEEYFADGLTEEILNALAKTPDLKVASRTSSFRFKNRNVDARMIADTLGVAHILEGSVRKSTDKIRITAQLIRASDGFHLWSETYDESKEDIIDIQEDIALKIASALETIMDPEDLAKMINSGTQSVEAYNDYLNGRAAFSNSDFFKAMDYFQSAIRADPRFAKGYEQIAQLYQMQLTPVVMNYGLLEIPDSEKLALFNEAINNAIQNANDIDRHYFEARKSYLNMDFRLALEQLDRYLESRPSDIYALNLAIRISSHLKAEELSNKYLNSMKDQILDNGDDAATLVANFFWCGKFDEGVEYAQSALQKNPYNNDLIYQAHRIYLWGGKFEEARKLLSTMTSKGISRISIPMSWIRQYTVEGKMKEAEEQYNSINTDPLFLTGQKWICLMWMGRTEEANQLLQPMDNESQFFSLSTWLHYPYFDITLYPNLYKRMQRENIESTAILPIPRMNPS